jgi:hypothetical protein
MQKQLDFKNGCFAEARSLLRATQDDREEDLDLRSLSGTRK